MALLHLGSVALLEGDLACWRGRTSRRPGSSSALPGTAWARRRRSPGWETSPGGVGTWPAPPLPFAEALDLARRVGGTAVVASPLAGQVDLARQAGDLARRAGATARAWRRSTARPTAAPMPSGWPGALVGCLIGLAGIEVAQGRPTVAARLLVAATVPMAAGWPPPGAPRRLPITRPGSRRSRAALGEAGFAGAFGAGRALSPPQALADALRVAGAACAGPAEVRDGRPRASAGRKAPGDAARGRGGPPGRRGPGPTWRSPTPCT